MVVESEKLRENLQTKVSQNIYQISRPCFSKFSDKRKQEKKLSNNWVLIEEIKHQYHEPQRFLNNIWLHKNAARFRKIQEEINRLVFSRTRIEIEMTDDDEQMIWKWFSIPELTNEPSWLVQRKKLLVKEGGLLIYHFHWSWIDKNFKDRWLSIISLARLVICFSLLISLAIN